MTLEPDTAELAPSRDPAAYGRKPLLGFGFWLGFFFCIAFLIGGYALAVFGPQILPGRSSNVAEAPKTPGSRTPARAQTAASLPAPTNYPTSPAPTSAAMPADATLEQRIARLESAENAVINAASAALAAGQLSQAAQGSRPFVEELAAVRAVMPNSPHVQALAGLAEGGAPSRALLAQEFEAQIQPVAIAVRAPGAVAGLLAHIGYALSSIVTVRRIGPDARGREQALSRIETMVREGDLEGASAQIDQLPGAARDQLARWRQRADRRIEVDRRIAAIRAEALSALQRVRGGG
jgi:hypothetical protein